MENFILDPRLAADCIEISDSESRKILLMNNAYYIWLILVPKTDCIELFDLPDEQRRETLIEMNSLSSYIKSTYQLDKINVAAIGNVVSQLHIHIVGRRKSDPAWPGVVWGHDAKKLYSDDEIEKIKYSILIDV
jgi:diadenosine tetraphosphate (Ap4A) HIT family hydrolase